MCSVVPMIGPTSLIPKSLATTSLTRCPLAFAVGSLRRFPPNIVASDIRELPVLRA
jgi:hypothetical protein